MRGLGYLALTAVALAVSAALSYGLMTMGEPRAVWLWCDMLGAC
ncbi:hypothetical protein [Bauldia litoralis]